MRWFVRAKAFTDRRAPSTQKAAGMSRVLHTALEPAMGGKNKDAMAQFCLFTIVALFATGRRKRKTKTAKHRLRTVRGVVMDKSESPDLGKFVF